MTQAFKLSQFANTLDDTTFKANLTSGTSVTGTLPVANGGTGTTSLTANRLLVGSGTSSVSTVSNTTQGGQSTFAGYLLTYQGDSNNPTWEAPAVTGLNMTLFTSSGTWTVPSGVTKAFVVVVGASAGSGGYPNNVKSASGGYAMAFVTGLSGSIAITVGTGGWGSTGQSTGAGGNSSFGTYVSATGGGAASGGNAGARGSGTVTTGTAMRTGYMPTQGLYPFFTTYDIPYTATTNIGAGGASTVWTTSAFYPPGTGSYGSNNYGIDGAVYIQY